MPDPIKDELEALIEQNGGVLVRDKRHNVYKFPCGLVFTVSQTPECRWGFRHALDDLKRFLNLHDPDRGKPGERRQKKRKPPSTPPKFNHAVFDTVAQPSWKEKLAAAVEADRWGPTPAVVPTPRAPQPSSFERMMAGMGVKKREWAK